MAKKKRAQPEKKKSNKLIYAGLAVLVLAAMALYFSYNSAPAQPDIFQPTEPGKVKIVEFLKFDCIHCYNLHKELPGILNKYGDNVSIAYVPIVFPGQSTKSVEAYLIAEQMGKGKEMQNVLFNVECNYLRWWEKGTNCDPDEKKGMDIMESSLALETVALSIGLGTDFKSKLDGNEARKGALSNLALMNKYNVQGTPTVFINGKQIIPTQTNIDTIISSMLG